MFKKFSKYLLIGVSALVLLAAAQQGLFNKQDRTFVLAEECQEGKVCPQPQEPVQPPCTPTWNKDPFGECDWSTHTIWDVQVNSCTGERQRTDIVKRDAPECGFVVPPAPTPQPPAPAPQPVCVKPTNPNPPVGCFGGLCCAVCGDKTCDGFNGENAGNCAQDCAPAAPAPQPPAPVQPAQQAKAKKGEFCGGNIQCEGHLFCPGEDQSRQLGIPKDICTEPIISQPAPQPPAPQCRSINCPAVLPPAGCAISGRITSTCDPSVTLTCGNLVCNPVVNLPAQGGNITNNNTNNDNDTISNTNTITISNPAPQVAQAAAVQPRTFANVGVGSSVAGVQYVTALPKTGLPLFAWAAAAFLPAGFKMRRFSKVKRDLENNPNYIWEERQFRNGS